jgi:Ycf66 protein N-terminus
MIHIEFIPSTLLGISLTTIGFFLCLIRTKKPMLSREYDIFFSSAGFLCGGILIFEGWRLDPILLLSQILSSGIAIFFIIESLLLRRYIGQTVKPILFPLAERSKTKTKKDFILNNKKIFKIKKKNYYNYTNPIEYKKIGKIDYYCLIES